MDPSKRTLTLYLVNGVDSHAEQLERLGEHSVGEGCRDAKCLDDVDRAVLMELIKEAAQVSALIGEFWHWRHDASRAIAKAWVRRVAAPGSVACAGCPRAA